MDTIIKELLKLGAPYIFLAILFFLYHEERKKSEKMADKLYELGMAQVKKDTEVESVLKQVQKDVEEIRRQA